MPRPTTVYFLFLSSIIVSFFCNNNILKIQLIYQTILQLGIFKND